MAKLFANSGDHGEMLHSAVSDLDLHCLPSTLLGFSRPKLVKGYGYTFRGRQLCQNCFASFWKGV